MSHYQQLADFIEDMPVLVRRRRYTTGESLREVADQIGVAASTVQRVEYGREVSTYTLLAVLRWLERPTDG